MQNPDDLIKSFLNRPMSDKQIIKDSIILGPPRSGKSTFIKYNNLGANEETLGLVVNEYMKDSMKDSDETKIKKLINWFKNLKKSIESESRGFIPTKKFEDYIRGRLSKNEIDEISKKEIEKLLNYYKDNIRGVPVRIKEHIDVILNKKRKLLFYWVDKIDKIDVPFNDENLLEYAKINWMGIDYYAPRLLKYDMEKLKEARKDFEEFLHKQDIPVTKEEFYSAVLPAFLIDFTPGFFSNLISQISGIVSKIFPYAEGVAFIGPPMLSGLVGFILMSVIGKKEEKDVNKGIIEIINGWKKLDDEFKHIAAAKVAFEMGLTEEEVYRAYEALAAPTIDEIIPKVIENIRPMLDEQQRRIQKIEEKQIEQGKIIQKIEEKEEREKLKPIPPEKLEEIKKTFLKPNNFEEIRESIINGKLIVIKGPDDIGKKTLAYMIFYSIDQNIPIYGLNPSMIAQHYSEFLELLNKKNYIVISDILNPLYNGANHGSEVYESYNYVLNELFQNRGSSLILTTDDNIYDNLENTIDQYKLKSLRIIEDNCEFFNLNLNNYLYEELVKFFKERVSKERDEFLVESNYNKLIKNLDELVEEMIENEIFIPSHINNFIKTLERSNYEIKNFDDEMKKVMDFRNLSKNWFIELNNEDDINIVFIIAFFPNLSKRNFISAFNIFYPGKKLNNLNLERFLKLNLNYVIVDENNTINFRNRQCYNGIWEVIEDFDEVDFKEYSEKIFNTLTDPDLLLQATKTLLRLSKKYPGILQYAFNRMKGNADKYEAHLLALIIANIISNSDYLDINILDYFVDIWIEMKDELIFILRKMFHYNEVFGSEFLKQILMKNVFTDEDLKYLINKIGNGLGIPRENENLLITLRNIIERKASREKDLIEYIDKRINELKLKEEANEMPLNDNFIKDFKNWAQSDDITCRYEILEENGIQVVKGIENDEKNLGRFFQDLTHLYLKVLQPGVKLTLEGLLKAENITAVGSFNKGLAIGISFVDENGWSPNIESYQCEIGHLVGSTNWVFEKKDFILSYKPPTSTNLIIYIDFNHAKGVGYVKNISLKRRV